MEVYKDCEEYYLHGDNCRAYACWLAEKQGIDTDEVAVVTLRFPGRSENREVSEMIALWLVAVAKQEA